MKLEDEVNELAGFNPDAVLPEPEDPKPEEAAATEAPADEATLLRVRLRTGKEYTGKTEKEILRQLVEDHERLALDHSARETQTREAQGKIRYQEERKPLEGYDDQKYLDLLGKDTMAARRYQDQYLYGLAEGEDPAEAFRFTYHVADRIADTIEVSEFQRMNKDAAGNPVVLTDNDAALLLREVDREGLTLTARNLTGVYLDLVNRNVIQRGVLATGTKYQDVEFEKPQSRGAGAPRGTGGGSRETSTSNAVDYEKMSFEEIQKEARKKGLL